MPTKSTSQGLRTHPVHGFVGAALAALDGLGATPAGTMTRDEQVETLVELTRLQARISELRLRVLAAADRSQVAEADGSTSTAAWLSARTREVPSRTHDDLRVARAVDDPGFAPTRAAWAAGDLTDDQARVIVRAVEDLPEHEVSSEARLRAQRHLVSLAADHDAARLRVLGRRLFEVIAPAESERREGAALEAEEQRARERCRLTMHDNHDGTVSGRFILPLLPARMLQKALQAFAAPRRAAAGQPPGDRPPYRGQLGRAFAELVEHLPVDRLPQAGGAAATVVVTIGLESLRSALAAASLDTGDRISASEARRLACTSGLLPVALGSDSVPLDVGRTSRLYTAHQRRAMGVRDGGCTAEGCDRPPAWCEAHHELPWSAGGGTSLATGRLLCPRHHRLAHDPRYRLDRTSSGQLRFHRRT